VNPRDTSGGSGWPDSVRLFAADDVRVERWQRWGVELLRRREMQRDSDI